MNIKLEHVIIVVLLLLFLYRRTQNEERLQWTDYRGHNYDVRINRDVH